MDLLPVDLIPVDQVLQEYTRNTYTYQELLMDPPPKGVDKTKLEVLITNIPKMIIDVIRNCDIR